jgi:hypothetical protein
MITDLRNKCLTLMRADSLDRLGSFGAVALTPWGSFSIPVRRNLHGRLQDLELEPNMHFFKVIITTILWSRAKQVVSKLRLYYYISMS